MKYAKLKTKKARIAHIREALTVNNNWAIKGLLRIYNEQTDEEQACEDTMEHNGVGFSGVDGNILSSFSKQIINGRELSLTQMKIVHKVMPKYAGQLERLSIVAVNKEA